MNTRFFHASASARKKTNTIKRLQGEDGIWYDSAEDLGSIVIHYFQHLFSDSLGDYDPIQRSVEPLVSQDDNNVLDAPFFEKEFTDAISQIHPDK